MCRVYFRGFLDDCSLDQGFLDGCFVHQGYLDDSLSDQDWVFDCSSKSHYRHLSRYDRYDDLMIRTQTLPVGCSYGRP
jgi:hypothetical protein